MGNFFSNLIGRREVGGGRTATDSPSGAQGAEYDAEPVYVRHDADALKISAYYRGLELRATTMGQLIWQLQHVNREGGNFVPSMYGENRRLNYLLQVRPNPMMSAFELARGLELSRVQNGNGYIYIERDTYGIQALWLCKPQATSYQPITHTYAISFDRPSGPVAMHGVPAGDIIHVRNTFCHNGQFVTGVGVLPFMSSVLSLEATNTKLQTDNAAKGGKNKVLLKEASKSTVGLTHNYNKSEVRKAQDRIENELHGRDIIAYPSAFENPMIIGQSAADMQILESRRLTVEDVSRFLAVPKILLGDGSNSSYKSPDAAMQDFMLHTIQPAMRQLENEFAAKLLTPEEFGRVRIHVCDRDLRRLDTTAQAALNKQLIEMGALTVNEVRKMYDQPAVEYGDSVCVSVQCRPLSDMAKMAAEPPAEPTPAETAEPEEPGEGDEGNEGKGGDV